MSPRPVVGRLDFSVECNTRQHALDFPIPFSFHAVRCDSLGADLCVPSGKPRAVVNLAEGGAASLDYDLGVRA